MDSQTFDNLQFFDALGRVSAFCQSPLGRAFTESIRPHSTFDEVESALAPVREAIAMLEKGEGIALGALEDPNPIWDAIGPVGHALEGKDLSQVATFLETTRVISDNLRPRYREAPTLARMATELIPMTQIERDLRRAILPDGKVSDKASVDLARIRTELRRVDKRVRTHVDHLLEQLGEDDILQESYATTRNNRYVFPVRANFKGRVPGILHSASQTGETLFIEPASVLEISNELETLKIDETREELKIRSKLTERIRPHLPQLRKNTERLAEFDSIWGRAKMGRRAQWHIPKILNRCPLRLKKAHHPLLILDNASDLNFKAENIKNAEEKEEVKPKRRSIGIQFMLEANDYVIVVSGPNAGGKTTFLKTIGLAVLLTQSGIPAPIAPESQIPVFTDVWVDIGDAQNVLTGQSTFSAHARRLGAILKHARSGSLVLLDEFAAATDPTEGAALAEASLELLRKRECLTVVTSHLTPLKVWAHEKNGARNASFALDETSQTPTFTLMLDTPGTSEALVIAEREGIPESVLKKATGLLEKGEANLSALLRSLGHRERSLADADQEIKRRLKALAEQEDLAKRRAQSLREERREQREALAKQREKGLAKLREEIESRIAALPSREAVLQEQRANLTQTRREVQHLQQDAETEHLLAQQSLPPMLAPDELVAGAQVYVIDVKEVAEIISVDLETRKAQVALERGLIVETSIDSLCRSPEEAPAPVPTLGASSDFRRLPDEDQHNAFGAKKSKKGRKKKRSKKIKRQETLIETREPFEPHKRDQRLAPLTWNQGGAQKQGRSKPLQPHVASESEPGGRVIYARKSDVPWQIDLHGMRVEEALERVDKYLDDAVIAAMPYAKLCHGAGTGALSKAVREFLATHPHVTGWRYGRPQEGGAGVTIVDLH